MVSDIKKGSPVRIPVGTFAALNADERKDIQRWIKIVPEIVDPDIVIVGEEVSHWDKSKKRPDLLGVDRDGKLVVIELKRKASDKEHDFQVLRYASFVSTLSLEQVVELFAAFKAKEEDGAGSEAEARKELEEFTGGAINAVDESEDPRIILVAPGFRQEVMSTVLWLRKYGRDISCVRLEPLEISGKAVLSATTVVPLPEASEYEIGLREKQQAASAKRRPIDRDQVREFIASIPEGH